MSAQLKDSAKIEGMELFCSKTGFDLAEAKAAKKTPEGAAAFFGGTRIDHFLLSRVINTMRKSGKKKQLTESEARTRKIEAETRKIERDELLEEKLLHDENYCEQKFRHEMLMPLRDGLQGLQKKYHRFKATKPKIAVEILETDLPALMEKLSGEIVNAELCNVRKTD